MKKWLTLGVCVTILSMLTGIYPTSTVNLNNTSVHAEEVQQSIGTVENVNQLDGTFDIIVSPENVSDVKSVRVPIWSEKSRKIVWYDAEKQNDGRWVAHFNFKNHDYLRGSYHFHVYIYTVDGKSSSYDLGKVQLEEFQSNVSAKVQNIDTVNGTYDIVIQANSGAGIHHITVPIWSKADKSDLKNYEAVNENGQWVVHFNKQNHQNHIGIYHNVVEAYFNDHTGKRISMENVEIKGEPLTLEGNIVNINSVNGSYDVVIKADAPEGVKSVRVPIWTNAKDIKWYQAKQQADGTWTVHMDIKNHNNHLGKYTTHVYMTTNYGRETAKNLGQTEIVGQPLELNGQIINVNSKAGSYDVVVNVSAPSGVKSVRVPIWTNAKDIKWYQAKKQKDGTWTVHMDIKNHNNHLGKYTTHVYMTANDGRETAKNLGQTELKGQPLELTGKIINVNSKAGSYDVVVNASAPSGVKSVRVPIWTNAKDIKWYQAKKQKDGTWTVHMDIKNHNNHLGKYTTHVYMTANDGRETAKNLGQTELKGQPLELKGEIKNINSQSGSYDVVVNASAPSGVKSVRVPIWTNAKDIKWYQAKQQADGTWTVHMDIKNHNNHLGKYTTHVYMTTNYGRETAKNLGQTEIAGQPLELNGQIINVNSKAGSYDVVVNASAPSGVKSVRVPIWTNAKDIKWYQAKKQKDGTWTVHMDIKNHSNHLGKYTTHVYMTANDGRETARNLGQTELKGRPLELTGKIINVNSKAGSYDVVVNASAPSGVKSVRVPIWTNAKDIKWYQAKKQKDGTWTVHMDIRNHNYSKGSYTTHVYMTSNDGHETAISLNKKVEFDLPVDGFVTQIKDIDKNTGTYTVIIDVSKNINVSKVSVPTWNTLNKNVVWYNAEKVGVSIYKATISVKNHNNLSGTYVSYVYVTDNSNNTISKVAGNVVLDNDYESKYGKKLVFLDPGHGGYDSGAVSSSGTKEKDITLSVSNLVKNKLSTAGYQVIMSRYDDRYIDFVTERSRMSNVANADIFVSIHVNSGGGGVAQGVEVYWYEYDSAYPPQINQAYHNDPIRLRNSERLANSIQSNIIKQTSAINRGIRRQTYAVVREAKAPAVLVETGYIDNRSEELRLKSTKYQEKLAQGIVDGIKQYFNN